MEDTLREKFGSKIQKPIRVLILVLMEDTLRDTTSSMNRKGYSVLILVLMEDTLREQDIRILYISGIGIYKPKQIGFY